MFIRWKYLIAAVVVAPVLALLVAWSGLVSIGARSGHWAITDWFLHWSMQSSVRTASLSTQVPPFDNPEMLKLAAGHYEAGCAMCHGSPARERSAVVFGMLPVPPDLKPRIPTWTDAELFHIVEKGVRFTGMPAWPAEHREDEVWSMVAFLRKMPNLNAGDYRTLAGISTPEGQATALGCQSCHDEERLNGKSLIPSLAGQSPEYLRESLSAYQGRPGKRCHANGRQRLECRSGGSPLGLLCRHAPQGACGGREKSEWRKYRGWGKACALRSS
jgi:mono/diheme cytochrome c family protein